MVAASADRHDHRALCKNRSMSPASEMPQFAILYGGRSSDLTPRQAFLLWSGLQLQLDDFIGAAEGETSLIDITSSRLPRIARVYETTEFRRGMETSAQTLIERLCSGYFSDALAHTTSEEVLLCMAIDRVAELLTDMPDALLHDGIDSDIRLVDEDDADLNFYAILSSATSTFRCSTTLHSTGPSPTRRSWRVSSLTCTRTSGSRRRSERWPDTNETVRRHLGGLVVFVSFNHYDG